MHSVDLAYLRRHAMLTPGKTASLAWSKCGHETGSIRIVAEPDGVRLLYRATGGTGHRSTSTSSCLPLHRYSVWRPALLASGQTEANALGGPTTSNRGVRHVDSRSPRNSHASRGVQLSGSVGRR
jgi:hypothetical protein